MFSRKTWICILFVLLLAASVAAVSVPVTIRVRDSSLTSLSGASVRVYKTGFDQTQTTTSTGSVTFNLTGGLVHNIAVSKSGFTSVNQTINPTAPSEIRAITLTSSGVNISVKARAVVGGISQTPLASATTTYIVGTTNYPGGTTDTQGYANPVTLQPGQTFKVKVEKTGYTTVLSQIYTVPNITPYNVIVSLANPASTNVVLKPRVFDAATGLALSGASVSYTFSGYTYPGGTTTSEGYPSSPVTLQPNQSGTITVSKTGYTTKVQNYTTTTSALQTPYINVVPSGTASGVPVTIRVRNSSNVNLDGATVRVYRTGFDETQSTQNGMTSFNLTAGIVHNITVTKSGYNTVQQTMNPTPPSEGRVIQMSISSSVPMTFSVTVKNLQTGNAVVGASVTVTNVSNNLALTHSTNSNGIATFTDEVNAGQEYRIRVTASGYNTAQQNITLTAGSNQPLFTLTPTGSAPSTCGNGVCESNESTITCSVDCGGSIRDLQVGAMVTNASTRQPVMGASVTLIYNGQNYSLGTTYRDGYSSLSQVLPQGAGYVIRVSAPLYQTKVLSDTVRSSGRNYPYYHPVSLVSETNTSNCTVIFGYRFCY